jgi:hypothetical protein
VPTNWKPEQPVPAPQLTPDEMAALNDLTTVWLSASFPRRRAEKFAKEGIDPSLAAIVKVDEKVWVASRTTTTARSGNSIMWPGVR